MERKVNEASSRRNDGVTTLYWMNGCDHRDLDTQVGLSVKGGQTRSWNLTIGGVTAPVLEVFHSNLEDVARIVKAEVEQRKLRLDVIHGEMRAQVDHLADVTSSGMSLKRRNWAVQELLESWAEPLNVAAVAVGAHDESADLRRAWKLVLENHFHDTLCTTSAPQVLIESRVRADRAILIAQTIASQHMSALMLSRAPRSKEAVFVFNPTNVKRVRELVVAWIRVDRSDNFEAVRDACCRWCVLAC